MSIPISIKKQLAYIIKNNRKYKYDITKKYKWIDDNIYKKENLCKNICHYHTLTKLENDYIKNDEVYYLLLNKLGFLFNVTTEEHIENMHKIYHLLSEILKASEYLDDDLMHDIIKKINNIDFHRDCIAYIHVNLLIILSKLYFFHFIDDFYIEQLKIHKDLYSGLFKGVYNYVLGIVYINRRNHEYAYTYFLKAKKKFEENRISKSLVNIHLMSIYMIKRDYLKMVNLCLEMEVYFKDTRNIKRLLHVYYYLADYFLIINSYDIANKYYRNSLEIIHQDISLKRYYFSMEYNWGLYLFKNYKFLEALEHMKLALDNTTISQRKLQIINIILFLMTKLKVNKLEIIDMIKRGEECYKDGFILDQTVFKYFVFKYQNNPYYRRYAVNKLIPLLKSDPQSIDLLLIIYQDIYE